jgi:gas vesicle protein
MVENGKISVDDAVKLIEAIKTDGAQYGEKQSFFDSIEFEDKINRFSNSAENFAKDISARVNETWKGVEPKVKCAARTAIEKTVVAIDKVSGALSESLKTFDENQNPETPVQEDAPADNGAPPENAAEATDNEPKEN